MMYPQIADNDKEQFTNTMFDLGIFNVGDYTVSIFSDGEFPHGPSYLIRRFSGTEFAYTVAFARNVATLGKAIEEVKDAINNEVTNYH